MLTSAIIYLFRTLLAGLIFVLPNASALPSEISEAITFFVPKFSAWNSYIPVSTILTIIGLVITFETGILLFHLIDWTYKKIRG